MILTEGQSRRIANREAKICCVLVHGTFAGNCPLNPWSKGGWARNPRSYLRGFIEEHVSGIFFVPFEWSGLPRQSARYRAAARLTADLAILCQQFDHIFVIGHSHGGNVALQAIQSLGNPNVSVAAIATPFLKVRPAAAAQNLRVAVATVLTFLFLAVVADVMIRRDFWAVATIIEFAVGAAVYAVAVLSSSTWLPMVTTALASHMIGRRALYENLQLEQPIRTLVLYYPVQDEITKWFTSVRRRTLQAVRLLRRASARAEIDSGRWLASSPNVLPAIWIAIAGALAVVVQTVENIGVKRALAILSLLASVVGLAIFLVKYVRAGASAAACIGLIFLNSAAKIVYSTLKAGHMFDFISVTVRARPLPTPLGSRFPVTIFAIPSDQELSWWATLIDRLTFKAHRRIVTNDCGLKALTRWMNADTSGKGTC